ncbi:monocarboxylate permease-like protein, mch4 [Daldinia eschscholtzii]|nr:monocarboxylate permease-like protein, mch4 [Daldinia eschscholtzii]
MARHLSPLDVSIGKALHPTDENSNEEKKELEVTEVVVSDEGGPPDGGSVAWLQVLGSFALYFNHWGTINTFGVFQTYYENELLRHMSPSDISWIGSTQSFLLLGVGVVSGPLYDAGFLRSLLVLGSFLMILGMMLTSICTEYWQVMLAQGLCVGVGAGCLFVPSVAVIPEYFNKRKPLAMGVVTCGSSFGGVIYALMFQGLLSRVGFGWTTRIMGFTIFVTTAIPLLVLRRRTSASKVRSLIDASALREPPYIIYCLSLALNNVAFFAPIFYLQSYSLLHGLEGQTVALYLVAILNAASVLGRLTPSLIANRIGPVHTLFLSIFLTGITVLAWTNTTSGIGNILFAIAYGFFTGGIVALPAVVLTSFTTDLSRLGTRLGMSSMLNGGASLVGAPIAGKILNATGSYLGVQLFSGFLFIGTAMLVSMLRFAITGKTFVVKA